MIIIIVMVINNNNNNNKIQITYGRGEGRSTKNYSSKRTMTEQITEMLTLFVQFSIKDSWNTFSRLTYFINLKLSFFRR